MSAVSTATDRPARGPVRRVGTFLFRHPKARLAALLAPPLGWMAIVYLASLAFLLVAAFRRIDPLTSSLSGFTTQNLTDLLHSPGRRSIAIRTLGLATGVSVMDLALAFPIAYYAARMASSRMRSAILLLVVMPLWSNYLVRMFSWKVITAGSGPLESLLSAIGFHKSLAASNWAVWLTLCYLWLPFAILPVYAAFERVPGSLMEASSDLGAHAGVTFRRVVIPLILPGLVAGSLFTFSLSLGDYITPTYVGKGFFIGNAIYNDAGVANNLPGAATFALVPVVIMAIYLAIAKRLGAFEAL